MEQVVLLDDNGNGIGYADKAAVHHQATPLHLAFSAYVFNPSGELLVTRRAPTKKTWPGVWTNSCCGHPAPGEELPDAVARRLDEELGISATKIDLVIPNFRYRAVMPNGIAENEVCPVYRVRVTGVPRPDPAEVAAFMWSSWETFVASVGGRERGLSPWCRAQVGELDALGPAPEQWPVASNVELPPAARNAQPAVGGSLA